MHLHAIQKKEDRLQVLAASDGRRITTLTETQRRVLDKCSDDDPAVVFDWSESALTALAAHFGAFVAARPPWMAAPAGVATPEWVKNQLLIHVTAIAAGARPLQGRCIIAPLSLQEYSEVISRITYLCTEPNIVAAYAAHAGWQPIARVLFVADGCRPALAVNANVAVAPAYGCQAFV